MKATVFEFTSYVFEPSKKKVTFNYKTKFSDREPMVFSETILLPKSFTLTAEQKKVLPKLLESLHLILGISYYKFYCATKVSLPYQLSKEEANFWNTVYKKGLGEFFYKNKLDPKISPKFPVSSSLRGAPKQSRLPRFARNDGKVLVGIGGGKDSIVTAELLKENGFDITTFVIETGRQSELVQKIIEIIGVGDLKIQRQLDQKVHDQHLYNGHIPVSAIYAFLGTLAAVLYGYNYVIVGNEHSSNFGNINYRGLEVNHQWSKSYEFEKLFQDYIKDFITPSVFYFSLLRPFYEIRIVKMFAKYPKYFAHFSSCNRNFALAGRSLGEGRWCGVCPKCVFVWTLLSAFLPKQELIKMFGNNLYANESLLPMFKDVLGFGDMKPFDCVGTFEEAQTALFLAKEKPVLSVAEGFADDFIVRHFGSQVKLLPEVFQTTKPDKSRGHFDGPVTIPPKADLVGENSVPEAFKFLGMQSAYILGYGREGKITKQYLKKQYPKLKIGVGDSALDKDYLENQKNFDIAIKTPGIKKELVTIPYTTATNIFFSHLRQGFGGQAKISGKNIIIGVTGSKGKSTTASLIYHILKTAGKDVQLLGNIGTPMLEVFTNTQHLTPNTYFVLELSSYQLDDLHFSPDISVVTNLFQEHVDYHGNVKNYWAAKKNIINYQTKNGGFVYNPGNKESIKWLQNYHGKAVPFSQKKYQTSLIGPHNQENIGAAVAVAQMLKIPASKIQAAVKSFKALPHRLELVGTFKGITFINDANATIPEATVMAIKSIPKIDTIFLGGSDRGYNFTNLEKTIKKYNIHNVVLFPDSGNRMIKNTGGLTILKTKSMKEAVKFAYQHTQKGKVCLLSCASPSYSLWKNFEEKGDEFKKFVKDETSR